MIFLSSSTLIISLWQIKEILAGNHRIFILIICDVSYWHPSVCNLCAFVLCLPLRPFDKPITLHGVSRGNSVFADDISPSIIAGKVWPHWTRKVAEMELTVRAISPSVGTLRRGKLSKFADLRHGSSSRHPQLLWPHNDAVKVISYRQNAIWQALHGPPD